MIPLLLVLGGAVYASPSSSLSNGGFTVQADGVSGYRLRNQDGAVAMFRVAFCVVHSTQPTDPTLLPASAGVKYNVVTWKSSLAKPATDKPIHADASEVGDGFDPRILKGDASGRTADAFAAAPTDCVQATGTHREGDTLTWQFPERPDYALSATMTMPAGNRADAPPILAWRLDAKTAGEFSVAYVGAPKHDPAKADELWQPLIWTGKRFPERSFLTLAFQTPVPSTFVTERGQTEGVVVDPSEFPFDPLPVFTNSRFGVALRTTDGQASPMVFAPVLGGTGSAMKAGDTFSFQVRPLVLGRGLSNTFEYTARTLYGFGDFRHNAIASLNTTLENVIGFGMSKWSHFREEDKGASYETDAPGTVKNVSSLNPLDMALVTDDEAIWEHRAYPYIQYMVSRGKYLFTTDETQKIQHPSYTLEGPTAPISELVALYRIFHGATPAFLDMAKEEYARERVRNLDVAERGDTWQNSLALFRATGDRTFLAKAVAGADAYLHERMDGPRNRFKASDGIEPFFWTQFVPDFAALTELYEQSGERRFLDAARKSAREFTQFVWFSPAVPDTRILVNKGGKAPVYWYLASKGHLPMNAPEERVPAWRLSEMGLTSESSGTSTGHRAIFMANFAPWLLRIGYDTGDTLLHDVARSAIIGRYASFPGYHINTARTTIYEKPGYPLHEAKELSVNSFHYNHVWPMASMLLDYLVTEATGRSSGRIHFPGEYIEAYAYLQDKAYGGQVGRFYDHEDAVLWMPAKLLTANSVEVNYIAARSANNDRLYLALTNESGTPLTTRIQLDRSRLPGLKNRTVSTAQVWRNGEEGKALSLRDGAVDVSLPPRGMLAMTIPVAGLRPRFQQKVMSASAASAWRRGYVHLDAPAARGMIFDFGARMLSAYVFLENGKHDYTRVKLRYSTDTGSGELTDDAFPWEFTLPLDPSVKRFSWSIEGVGADGRTTRSKTVEMQR
jgi:hypothetical protein